VSDVNEIGDHALGVLATRNTTSPFCEHTTLTRLHVCVVETANVTESPLFGRPSPLLSLTMVRASFEMLLTGPEVAVPSPCVEPELLNAAPLGLADGNTPTGAVLSEH
jgi:hypothetical protein